MAAVYIKGLPAGTDANTIGQIVSAYGTIKECKTLGGTGVAYVSFAERSEAEMVVQLFDGSVPPGMECTVKVSLASSGPPGGGAPGGSTGTGGHRPSMPHGGSASAAAAAPMQGGLTSVYVKGLPDGTDAHMFKRVISEYGTVKDCKMVGGGIAYVTFAERSEAEWVVQNLEGNIPQGMDCIVRVSFAHPQAGGGATGGAANAAGANRFAPYGGNSAAAAQMQGSGFGGKGCGGFGGCGGQMMYKGGMSGGGGIAMLKKMLMAAGKLPGGRWMQDEKTVVVKGLPDDTSDKDVYDIFSPFGVIHSEGVKALYFEDGRCKGTAFVRFIDLEGAMKACEALNGYHGPSGMLKVHRDEGDGGGAGSDAPKKAGDWDCPSCGYHNFASNSNCRKCGTPNPNPEAASAAQQKEMKPGDWACPSCGYHNFANNASCKKCGTPNPNPEVATSAKNQVMPGDWTCSSCGAHNFARNMACRKCGAPKPDGGGGAMAAMMGMMGCMGGMGATVFGSGMGGGGCGGPKMQMPGDWGCPSCGYHNFASNTNCKRCGTPRPI